MILRAGSRQRLRGAVALSLALVIWGCAKNPVTGRRQLMLISEKQEFEIGEGADKEVREQYGTYLDSPGLRPYVDEVGNALANRSERSDLIFHFEVLNTPTINAFALPGGFVYITRGMLERLSSEDELAMVLGHEIGHVTARHGAARLSTAYALQYGALLGAVISPETFANYDQLIGLAVQIGLSKYSREQESQADALGVTYAAEAGYQPRAGITVMKILRWMEGKEPGSLEKWFLSHPPAEERMADITGQVNTLRRQDPTVVDRAVKRDPYLRRIDGLIVGPHSGGEMVIGGRYYNKELAVSLRVPSGWEVDLTAKNVLVAMGRGDEELILLEADPMHTSAEPADVERQFDESLEKRGWTRTGGRQARTGQEVIAHLARYEGKRGGKPAGILKAFLVRGKYRWTFTAVTTLDEFEKRRPGYEEIALDIRFLSEADVEGLEPPRLRVIPAPAGATWASLAAEHIGGEEGAERLAFYNGLDPSEEPRPGMLIKIPPNLAVRP